MTHGLINTKLSAKAARQCLMASAMTPVNAATFFRKLKAWWPHYAGRPLRSVDGWLENGVLIADITRHYIITEFETDTAGKAVFKGRDILDLAGNEKRKRALCPKPNTGRLKSAINATSTTLTLSPAGVGSEYAISGRAVIGQEIVSFTRAGDVLTLTGRGLANTGADGHAANATVQQTAYWWKARPHVVLRELMVDYAGIPSSQINLTEWADESFLGAPMLRISTEITTPKEVSKLVAEMSVMGLSIWPDVEKNKIGYKTSRPIYDDATWEITDDDIAKGDVKMDSRDDKRLTAVFFQTVQINPLKDLGEDNFLAAHAIADGNAISANAYGDIKHVVQRIRWMNHGADFVARLLAKRYLNRFLTAPQQSKVTLRRDQFGGIGLADVVYITSRSMVDDDGRPKRLAYQVIGRSTAGSGLIDVTFQRYLYEARYGRIVANGSPDYSAATIEQKARGSYIVGPSLTFPDNTGPYVFS
ncbi:MAG: hypothetical protein U5N55_01515 [Cypionkella sp.]|nr:hypothetical protein [Cypionkella sp.]